MRFIYIKYIISCFIPYSVFAQNIIHEEAKRYVIDTEYEIFSGIYLNEGRPCNNILGDSKKVLYNPNKGFKNTKEEADRIYSEFKKSKFYPSQFNSSYVLIPLSIFRTDDTPYELLLKIEQIINSDGDNIVVPDTELLISEDVFKKKTPSTIEKDGVRLIIPQAIFEKKLQKVSGRITISVPKPILSHPLYHDKISIEKDTVGLIQKLGSVAFVSIEGNVDFFQFKLLGEDGYIIERNKTALSNFETPLRTYFISKNKRFNEEDLNNLVKEFNFDLYTNLKDTTHKLLMIKSTECISSVIVESKIKYDAYEFSFEISVNN